MSHNIELDILELTLRFMDGLQDDPERDKYCAGFDEAFRQKKARYKELTGKEWR